MFVKPGVGRLTVDVASEPGYFERAILYIYTHLSLAIRNGTERWEYGGRWPLEAVLQVLTVFIRHSIACLRGL